MKRLSKRRGVEYRAPETFTKADRSTLDDDPAVEQGEQSSEQHVEPPAPHVSTFEISVTASTDWPPSCTGVRPVLAAVAKMLEAAASGKRETFANAMLGMAIAARDWSEDLFG